MDAARQQLDIDIQRTKGTASMLRHLADAIDSGPAQVRGETYQGDAVEALLQGAELADKEVRNLRHVGAIYDRMVATPVAELRT